MEQKGEEARYGEGKTIAPKTHKNNFSANFLNRFKIFFFEKLFSR